MFSAAELINVVIGRGRARLWFRTGDETPPGEFPPAWKAWFAAVGERTGAVTGASAEAIVANFLQRELATPPRRAGELNRWQSFATLWRQQWQPPAREERRVRLLAYAITFVAHVFLLVILLWLAYVRFTGMPAPRGEEVVQVEYIGEGTPQEQGGGPPAGETVESASASAQAPDRTLPAPPRPQPETAQASPPAPVAPAGPPQPPAPTPTGAQPLQVTEVPAPDTDFILPPPTPRRIEVSQPQLTIPELQVQTREVEIVEAPTPVPAIQPQLPPVEITVPQLNPEVTQREVPMPLPKVQPREVVPRPVAAPELTAQAPQVRTREVPMPETQVAASADNAATATTTPAVKPAAGNTPAGTAPKPGGPPATRSGTQAASAAGAGPASTPKPGAWPTPQRGDDWGASTRNRPGGNTGKQPGLFNADGSPRLPSGTVAPGGAFPPGSDHWTRNQIDRAGTWLKRPPNDYMPTRFDRYWLPTGTLLEQWVRSGIRKLAIPIPGTSKKINCVISVLQLGGACGISDPDLNDQEAVARPPPDIPFKPELQEDQDSLRKPGAP